MSSVWAVPAIQAEESERAGFLRKVGALTVTGLGASAVAATTSALVIGAIPALWNQVAQLVIILGCWALAQMVFGPMIGNSRSMAVKLGAYYAGSISQGVALGYMLLVAVTVSVNDGNNPFLIVGQAMALTALTGVGMLGWLFSGPKDLSMVRGALAIAWLPMLALMAITFIFPVGGIMGILISAVFVAISTAGLLYQLNQVMHTTPTDRWVEGSYQITLGLLVLFWNILSLLSRRR